MSAPNIVNVANILGKSAVANLTGTTVVSVVSNTAGSGKVFKVNSITVANVDGSVSADITINYYGEDALGGTATELAKTIPVPADSTVVIVDKNTSIYLEEDRSIGAIASAGGDLKVFCSYEEIS
jgi:hypothetical protein